MGLSRHDQIEKESLMSDKANHACNLLGSLASACGDKIDIEKLCSESIIAVDRIYKKYEKEVEGRKIRERLADDAEKKHAEKLREIRESWE